METATLRKVSTVVARLDERLAVSMGEIEESDFIFGLGVDPVNEAPMLALSMRQAHKRGAEVVVVDPRPVFLPFRFFHLPVSPDHIDLCAAVMAGHALQGKTLSRNASEFLKSLPAADQQNPDLLRRMEELGRKLEHARKPVIVCGTDIVRESTLTLAADLANLFDQVMEGTGLFFVLPGPNAFGAGLLSSVEDEGSVPEILASGKVKALILVEQDLFQCRQDRSQMEGALSQVQHLLILDYLPSSSVGNAHVVLPTATLFERSEATFVNQEGRAQQTRPVHRGGTPLSRISSGDHPPRIFLEHIPGGEPKAAHQVLSELYAAISGEAEGVLLKDLWGWLAEENSVFKTLPSSADGIRLIPGEILTDDFLSNQWNKPHPREPGLVLIPSDRTFGTEELSSYSRFTGYAETVPRLCMHPDDADRLGLTAGERVALKTDGQDVVFELLLETDMAAGTLIVPRYFRGQWQKLMRGSRVFADDRIQRI